LHRVAAQSEYLAYLSSKLRTGRITKQAFYQLLRSGILR